MSATLFARAHARDRRGRREHLAHARAALRALVADDDDVAGDDPAAEDRLDRVLLGVEDARRAGVHAHLGGHRRLLDDRAVGREVAAQHAQAALGVVRRRSMRVDDARRRRRAPRRAISPIVRPVDRERVARRSSPRSVELAP